MYKKNVVLQIITPMFSAGVDENVQAEFRITELKALLRSTFREFFEYMDLKDLKEKEAILFGSTERKSPVTIRLGTKGRISEKKEKCKLVLHKNFKIKALQIGTEIDIIFQSKNDKFLEVYIDILKLASITGGLGKRSRKGMGSFIIKSIDEEPISINNFEQLSKDKDLIFYEVKTKSLEDDEKPYIFRTRKFFIEEEDENNYIKYKIEYDNNMPDIHYAKYLHKIFIGDDKDIKKILKNVSQLTHDRLKKPKTFITQQNKNVNMEERLNKEILGNYSRDLPRFASPVYVTLYQEVKEKKNYLIIKELNYNYIYEKISPKDLDAEYVKGYIDKIKECVR